MKFRTLIEGYDNEYMLKIDADQAGKSQKGIKIPSYIDVVETKDGGIVFISKKETALKNLKKDLFKLGIDTSKVVPNGEL